MRRFTEIIVCTAMFAISTRCFLLQGVFLPIQVSAGSMAESWYGPHRDFVCPACGFTYRGGIDRPPSDGATTCPNCRHIGPEFNTQPERPGDGMLIDRVSFAYRAPRRWETVVFRCPDNAARYCIKRVVGLPGEVIQIIDGDVYVNESIAVKELEAQRSCRILVHDARFAPRKLLAGAPRWNVSGNWQLDTISKAFAHASNAESVKQEIHWLPFQPGISGGLTDDYAYNQGESRRLASVNDLMLTGKVTAQSTGELWFRVGSTETHYDVCVSLESGAIRLIGDRQTMVATEYGELAGHEFEFEFSTFDRHATFAINRRRIIQCPLGASLRASPQSPWSLSIGARGGKVELRRLQVYRDIYYTAPRIANTPSDPSARVRLADDEFFVLGDNSPISDDSRTFGHAGIPLRMLVGKPWKLLW
ncbi:MAG: hypothetical protein KDA42_03275 [Planctomycetales bacterium]|nr:hypothetical protein [Planctomycetales bacterium]